MPDNIIRCERFFLFLQEETALMRYWGEIAEPIRHDKLEQVIGRTKRPMLQPIKTREEETGGHD